MQRNVRTQSNKNTLNILSRILSQENLVISFDPNIKTAGFDLDTRELILPELNCPEAVEDMFLTHEVSHALYTPSPNQLNEYCTKITNGEITEMSRNFDLMQLFNLTEDARIERLIKGKYAGLSAIYHKAYTILAEKGFFIAGFEDDEISIEDFETHTKSVELIQRLNIHAKCGSILDVEFSESELELVDKLENSITAMDTVELAWELYQLSGYSNQNEAGDSNDESSEENDSDDKSDNQNSESKNEDSKQSESSKSDDGDSESSENDEDDNSDSEDTKDDEMNDKSESDDSDGDGDSDSESDDNNDSNSENDCNNNTESDSDGSNSDSNSKSSKNEDQSDSSDDSENENDENGNSSESSSSDSSNSESNDSNNDDNSQTSASNNASDSKSSRSIPNLGNKFGENLKKMFGSDNQNPYANAPTVQTYYDAIDPDKQIITYKELLDSFDETDLEHIKDVAYVKANTHNSYQVSSKARRVEKVIAAENESVKNQKLITEKFNPIVRNISNQFNRKKKAQQFANSRQHKTGRLDMNNLHKYQFNNNIFVVDDISSDGKNHGIILLLDWSGSMTESGNRSGISKFTAMLNQTMLLVEFARSVGIAHRIFAFTNTRFATDMLDRLNKEKIRNSKIKRSRKKNIGKMGTNIKITKDSFALLELFNHTMSRQDFLKMQLCLRKEMAYSYSYYGHYGILGLGGTPLNASLFYMPAVIQKFKEENRIEKMYFSVLTDGESQGNTGFMFQHKNRAHVSGGMDMLIIDSHTGEPISLPNQRLYGNFVDIHTAGKYISGSTVSGMHRGTSKLIDWISRTGDCKTSLILIATRSNNYARYSGTDAVSKMKTYGYNSPTSSEITKGFLSFYNTVLVHGNRCFGDNHKGFNTIQVDEKTCNNMSKNGFVELKPINKNSVENPPKYGGLSIDSIYIIDVNKFTDNGEKSNLLLSEMMVDKLA